MRSEIIFIFLSVFFPVVAWGFPGDIVFDPADVAQTTLTAQNTAKELLNQAQVIQMALANTKNYPGNSGDWAHKQDLLNQLAQVVSQGHALSYNLRDLDQQFRQRYPGYQPAQDYAQSYQTWSNTALDTLRATLDGAGVQANDLTQDQMDVNTLKGLSQSAQGRMQALQVANMIATQQVAQLQALRQLTIAQTNAQNAYMAYQVQKEQAQQASLQQWIDKSDVTPPVYGSGHGFGPNNIASIHP
jgi:P-type conjugative transfer protein TrbJ